MLSGPLSGVYSVYVLRHSYFVPNSDALENVGYVKMRAFFSVPSSESVTKRLNCHYHFVLPPLSLVHNGNYVFTAALLLLLLAFSLLLWHPCTVRKAVQEASVSVYSLLSVCLYVVCVNIVFCLDLCLCLCPHISVCVSMCLF